MKKFILLKKNSLIVQIKDIEDDNRKFGIDLIEKVGPKIKEILKFELLK